MNEPETSHHHNSDTAAAALHDIIARQAQKLWEDYGRPADRDLEIWLEAEQQVLGADPKIGTLGRGAAPTDAVAPLHPSPLEKPRCSRSNGAAPRPTSSREKA
jgi:hypothetical protein